MCAKEQTAREHWSKFNSHVNRTDSAHSNNARSASNMIPCFPANNSTDVHHCDIVSSRSSPSHFTKDTPLK